MIRILTAWILLGLTTTTQALTFDEFVTQHYQGYLRRDASEAELDGWFAKYLTQKLTADSLSRAIHTVLSNTLRSHSAPLYERCIAKTIVIYPDYWAQFDCSYSHTKTAGAVAIGRGFPKAIGACNVPLYQCVYRGRGNIDHTFVSTSATCGGVSGLRQVALLTYGCRNGLSPNYGLKGAYRLRRFSHRHPKIGEIAERITIGAVKNTPPSITKVTDLQTLMFAP